MDEHLKSYPMNASSADCRPSIPSIPWKVTKRFACPRGIHSLTMQQLHSNEVIAEYFSKKIEFDQGTFRFNNGGRCCIPHGRILNSMHCSDRFLCEIKRKFPRCFEGGLQLTWQLIGRLQMSIAIQNDLSIDKKHFLWDSMIYGLRSFISQNLESFSLCFSNSISNFSEYSPEEECRIDEKSSLSIQQRFLETCLVPGVESHVCHLKNSWITLVHIDMVKSPASWVQRFLDITYLKGEYWISGHRHGILIPLFELSEISDIFRIPPEILPFSVILIDRAYLAGGAFLQHYLALSMYIVKIIREEFENFPIAIDPFLNKSDLQSLLLLMSKAAMSIIHLLPTLTTISKLQNNFQDPFIAQCFHKLISFHSVCGKFLRSEGGPRHLLPKVRLANSQSHVGQTVSEFHYQWAIKLTFLGGVLFYRLSNSTICRKMQRMAIDIVYMEYVARFGPSIFSPNLDEILLWRYITNKRKYVRVQTPINRKLVHPNIIHREMKISKLAVPIHGIHHSVFLMHMNLLLTVIENDMQSDTELLPRLLAIQIAVTNLLLRRLLFLENDSEDQERPDCFDVFSNDHV